jgi:hypothetical protein
VRAPGAEADGVVINASADYGRKSEFLMRDDLDAPTHVT